ncbi:hypothetical protein D9V41_07585 [Aeromicrobium phragmitis]|uniref:Cytochrome c-type biogenesis protein n=1 Tax=Aeromicrobium phragmitis TaxID=2478914 RepID=A0A3L8PLQ5_9ACTN|nr:cytochrome c-type biogenesis protein CcmH [Aeromicrobium phragmitis]RLV56281.1 hypothetical protein D9V41_07585 [Aeromicrobium phragmitis]
MSGAMRRWVLLASAIVAVVGLAIAVSSQPSRTLEQQTREVALTIRCPTCAGESIADSTAPVAGAMRLEIEQQLTEGRSPDEVRAWFADRYGAGIVLAPPARGSAGLLWWIPIGVVVLALLVLLRRRDARGRRILLAAVGATAATLIAAWWVTSSRYEPELVSSADRAGGDVLSTAVAQSPGDAQLRLAYGLALEQDGQYREAAEQFEAVTRLEPFDADARYLWASTLVRDGDVDAAMATLDEGLRSTPDHAPSLLLQGVLRWRAGDDSARPLLERFLELQPEDPAAEDVRGLLSGDRTVPELPGIEAETTR